jgi:hypothetical protein
VGESGGRERKSVTWWNKCPAAKNNWAAISGFGPEKSKRESQIWGIKRWLLFISESDRQLLGILKKDKKRQNR